MSFCQFYRSFCFDPWSGGTIDILVGFPVTFLLSLPRWKCLWFPTYNFEKKIISVSSIIIISILNIIISSQVVWRPLAKKFNDRHWHLAPLEIMKILFFSSIFWLLVEDFPSFLVRRYLTWCQTTHFISQIVTLTLAQMTSCQMAKCSVLHFYI